MRFGAYEVVKQLGAGGMGIVFHVRGPEGNDLALKLLRDAGKNQALARFERERRLLESLGEEAGFVPLVGAGTFPQGPYILMPYLPGGTLRARFERGPMPVFEALELARTLARAIGRAHALGIVHRDLKPDNVLFTAAGMPLIADLGLAKHFAPAPEGQAKSISLTRQGELQGTAGYMSPEQMGGGGKEAGPEADVFSLGAILYEALAGHPAFEGESLIEIFDKVVHSRLAPLRRLRPETPRWLARVIARSLARSPGARFADGGELLLALDRAGRPGKKKIALASVTLVAVSVAVALVLGAPGPIPHEPVAAPVTAPIVTRARPHEGPDWFDALPPLERPSFPLPRELEFGEKPGEYRNKKDGSVLIYVPGDTFLMGSEVHEDNEKPVHKVELSAHFIGKYEVTNGQFEKFVNATRFVTEALRMGSDWQHPRGEPGPVPADHPVANVTWGDARAYCMWAGLRLPTEAQWEHDAGWDRVAKRSRAFSWGDTLPGKLTPRYANLADDAMARAGMELLQPFENYDDGFALTAPVGSFPAGVAPSGALDMTGNVMEFCADAFDASYYSHSPLRDPYRAPDGRTPDRTLRGGSFRTEWWRALVTYRGLPPADFASDYVGFRVARDR